jgi:hypothetical protein
MPVSRPVRRGRAIGRSGRAVGRSGGALIVLGGAWSAVEADADEAGEEDAVDRPSPRYLIQS